MILLVLVLDFETKCRPLGRFHFMLVVLACRLPIRYVVSYEEGDGLYLAFPRLSRSGVRLLARMLVSEI